MSRERSRRVPTATLPLKVSVTDLFGNVRRSALSCKDGSNSKVYTIYFAFETGNGLYILIGQEEDWHLRQ